MFYISHKFFYEFELTFGPMRHKRPLCGVQKKKKSKSHCLETKHVEVDTQYYDVAENPSHLTSGSYLENINSHSGPHVQAAGGEMGVGGFKQTNESNLQSHQRLSAALIGLHLNYSPTVSRLFTCWNSPCYERNGR